MGQVRRISGKIWRKSGRILLSMCWDLGGAWLHLPPSLSEGNPLYRKHPYNQPHPSSYSMPASSCSSLECSATMAVAAETRFHVLAVDDSLLDRLLIERLLKTSSYQVTTVDSGSKALQILGLQDVQTNSPSVSSDQHDLEVNLIITDYCMPEMTGYDLLKKIKESSSLRDIPVVIMSSENVPSRINRCLEEGAEEFFLKPVQLSDMNRLKPHILKGKYKEEHEQQVLQNNSTTISNNSSNKRKAMDDEISLEMTRPRLTSSLTVL